MNDSSPEAGSSPRDAGEGASDVPSAARRSPEDLAPRPAGPRRVVVAAVVLVAAAGIAITSGVSEGRGASEPRLGAWLRQPLARGLALFALVVLARWRGWGVASRFGSWGERAASWSRAEAGGVRSRVRWLLARLDTLSARLLGLPAVAVAAAACALLLLTWVPHYLTWPWWSDTDQFAVSALAWHEGVRPYRDLIDFDFPGPIYVLYGLGAVVGWGRGGTLPFNAVDALLVVLLGPALGFWSRRRFEHVLPGLVGYLAFLVVYLSLDYSQVGQRDWHGPLLVVLGWLVLESFPSRAGRVASALATASALAYRPQVLVLLPALLSALAGDRPGGGAAQGPRPRRYSRSLAEWSIALAAAGLLVLTPLLFSGIFGDFVYNLRYARVGGQYNRTTWSSFQTNLADELADPLTVRILTANALLAVLGGGRLRAAARTSLLALAGVLVYKPMSPFQHEYLWLPLLLIRSVALVPPVAWVVSTPVLASPLRIAAVAGVLVMVGAGVPRYCLIGPSLRAIESLARGVAPAEAPPGCAHEFDLAPSEPGPPRKPSPGYRWSNYCRMLDYIRRTTSPRTRVANLLRERPWPPVNGPTGRLSPFPAAGGYLHLWFLNRHQEGRFARTLSACRDAVVVWVPNDPYVARRLRFPRLERVVHEWYRPEARFGSIEVWCRIDSDRPDLGKDDRPLGN
jgi:hypothetical protein